MSKKIIALFLAFVFVLPLFPVEFSKAADYDVAVTDVKIYKNGERLSNIVTGELSAEITVLNNGTISITPFIVAMICKGNEELYQTVSFASADNITIESGIPKTVPLTLQCQDSSGSFLKVMVFDNKNELNLVSDSIIYPTEKDIKLTDIKIAGKSVENFDADIFEYSVELPFGTEFPTEFTYLAYNEAATVNVVTPAQYGEYLTIKISIDDFGENTYKVLISEADDPRIAKLSDVKYDGQTGTVISPIALGSYRYQDTQDAFSDFGGVEFGENSHYIQPKYEDYENPGYKNTEDEWISFKINRSADVYVITYSNVTSSWLPWLQTEGYKAIGVDGELIAPNSDYTLKAVMQIDSTANSNGRKKAFMYKKTYTLPSDGSTIQKISFGGGGLEDANYGTYGVIVDFVDESVLLSDIKVNGESLIGFDSKKTEYELYNVAEDVNVTYTAFESSAKVTKDVTDDKITLTVENGSKTNVYTILRKEKTNDLQVIQTLSSTYTVVDSFDSQTKRYNDETYTFTNMDGFRQVIGNNPVKYIQTNRKEAASVAANYTLNDDYITFKINATANIYVITPYKVAENKYQPTLKNWTLVTKGDGTTAIEMTTNSSSSNATQKRGYIYKMKVTARDIYDYQTVSIKCPIDSSVASNQYVYTVLVEFLPETTASYNVKRGIQVFAEEAENKVVSLNSKVENGILVVNGTSNVVNGQLTAFVQNNGDLTGKDYSKIIYLNSVNTDDKGDFTVKVPLYEKRGSFQYYIGDKNGEITFDPTGDNSIRTFEVLNTQCTINGTKISVTLPYGTDVRGLIATFELHKDAKAYVNKVLQTSAVTKNDFSENVIYTVVADDGSEKVYNVTVNIAEKPVISSGGSGGGGGGNVGGISSSGGIDKVEVTKPEVSVTPEKEEIILDTFNDVNSSYWGYEAIEKLSAKGIINGFENGDFKPEESVTREQAIKMLVSAFNIVPASDVIPAFSDVDKSEWYNFYVEIAVQSGIVNGISETKFGVGMPITRQDVAVILNRIIIKKSLQFTENEKMSFTDSKDIKDYSLEAIDKISSYGLIKGYPDGTFNPNGFMTRAEFSVLLQRALKI